MKVKIFIKLKESVLDPQGKAVMGSMRTLGFDNVRSVRVGKMIELEVEDSPRDEIVKSIGEMCGKLLVNTVIEQYRFEIDDTVLSR
ncbi:MAG: phosphoribosylformylglycinamidine synthase subunit PurS [Nitrospirae bacterium]|nr:phosphoribosylformylglycinamidine synthase subunit PurS [Nitrospirota bacterium]